MVEVVTISSGGAERTGLGFFWGIWQSQKDQVLNKKAYLKPGGGSQTKPEKASGHYREAG